MGSVLPTPVTNAPANEASEKDAKQLTGNLILVGGSKDNQNRVWRALISNCNCLYGEITPESYLRLRIWRVDTEGELALTLGSCCCGSRQGSIAALILIDSRHTKNSNTASFLTMLARAFHRDVLAALVLLVVQQGRVSDERCKEVGQESVRVVHNLLAQLGSSHKWVPVYTAYSGDHEGIRAATAHVVQSLTIRRDIMVLPLRALADKSGALSVQLLDYSTGVLVADCGSHLAVDGDNLNKEVVAMMHLLDTDAEPANSVVFSAEVRAANGWWLLARQVTAQLVLVLIAQHSGATLRRQVRCNVLHFCRLAQDLYSQPLIYKCGRHYSELGQLEQALGHVKRLPITTNAGNTGLRHPLRSGTTAKQRVFSA